MADFAGPGACRSWWLREPLTDQWARCEPTERDRRLRFWLRASEDDEWTFDQVHELFASRFDAGDVPAALQRWANEVHLCRRQRPTRTGPKHDRRADYKAMVGTVILTELFGLSKRAAYREIAPVRHRGPEAIESAAKRGSRWPPGAWVPDNSR